MTKFELLAYHMTRCIEARQLMEGKNESYSNGPDPFRNFRKHGAYGIIVRLEDKLQRLQSLTETGKLEMCGESVRDTVLDIINYAILFGAMSDEKVLPQATEGQASQEGFNGKA